MSEKREPFERSAQEATPDARQQAEPAALALTRAAAGPCYHVVITEPDGGTSLHTLVAYGDDEAIVVALTTAAGRPVAIWDGERLIERFNMPTS